MKRLLFALALALTFAFVACSDDESTIGLGLQDPLTLYDGIRDTLYGNAVTVLDDSLSTTGYTQGLIGSYSDGLVSSQAMVYTQLAYTSEGSINFDGSQFDSVVLSLSLQDPYPQAVAQQEVRHIHFEVARLAEQINSEEDYTYYNWDSIPIDPAGIYFNGTVTMLKNDTAVRLKLEDRFAEELLKDRKFDNNAALIEALRGLRIRIIPEPDHGEQMYTLNFNAVQSGLFIYRRIPDGDAMVSLTDQLSIGTGGKHFNRIDNQYLGLLAPFNTNPEYTLDGSDRLYLLPMGGTRVKVEFDEALRRFREDHPKAVVHYAELRLPKHAESDEEAPERLWMLKVGDTATSPTPDLSDGFTSSTLQLGLNAATNSYHLRMTQHVQHLLREGRDQGTYIVINARRSSPRRLIANGTTGSNPARIILVYTEL